MPGEEQMLAEIGRQTFYDTFYDTCTEDDMTSFLHDYFNLSQVQKELSDPNDHFYVLLEEGVPAGYMRFKEDYESFPHMKQWKALELKRLYFLKEYHGKGMAQKMMDFFQEYALEHSYEVIWLGVWEHNTRAQKFYKKQGFGDSGYSHDFPIGNTPQTDLWFWKFLNVR